MMIVTRKQLLVDREFQVRFLMYIIAFCAPMWFLGLVCGIAINVLVTDGRTLFSFSPLLVGSAFVGMTLAVLGCVMLVGLVLSHRISGPLYRLMTAMQEMTTGSIPPPIRFREGDFHSPLADSVNEVLDMVREERLEQFAEWQSYATRLSRLAEEASGPIVEKLQAAAADAQHRADHLMEDEESKRPDAVFAISRDLGD